MNDYKYKFIFNHIPKTAGSSIKYVLSSLIYDPSVKQQFLEKGHFLMSYRTKHAERRLPDQELFKFTFVRNPWDRAVSCYHYLKAGGNNRWDKEFAKSALKDINNFSEFILNLNNIIDIPYFKCGLNHMSPMYKWLDGPVDYIGRVENIKEDFKYICDKLNVSLDLDQRWNQSKRSEYQKYYNTETKNIVGEIYHEDIIRYNYSYKS